MKSVTQEDEMGCSVACVAVAVNDSYQNAKELFTHPENATTIGYGCQEIIHALRNSGLDYSFRKVEDKTRGLIKKIGAIVLISGPGYPYKHYLINTESGWMDSWTNLPKLPAKSDFRKELPGEPEWVLYPK